MGHGKGPRNDHTAPLAPIRTMAHMGLAHRFFGQVIRVQVNRVSDMQLGFTARARVIGFFFGVPRWILQRVAPHRWVLRLVGLAAVVDSGRALALLQACRVCFV